MNDTGRLVIIGRSPFVGDVDIERILALNVTLGINLVAHLYPVDYAFTFDAPITPMWEYTEVWAPYHCSGQKNFKAFKPVVVREPLLELKNDERGPYLGYCYFTVSCAVNWALFNGFKEIYLVGVDHNDNDRRFTHFDGIDPEPELELLPIVHQGVKQFIKAAAKQITIYQTNPSVQWEIPHRPIEDLY